jgi:hypothetical protein
MKDISSSGHLKKHEARGQRDNVVIFSAQILLQVNTNN